MAETSAKGLEQTLTRKVGPLPLWAWLAAGGGLFWYFRKEQAASSASTTPAATQSQTGYGTDPAGNVGYIDPETGYVYGSAEDISALQSQGQVAANTYDTSGGTGDTSGDGSAAGSVDTSGQTTGTTTPSGTSTTTPGAPAGPTTPTTGAAAPKSSSYQFPAPSGLQASNLTDTGFRLQWNAVKGPAGQTPTGYTVQTYQGNTKVDQFSTQAGNTNTAEYGSGGKGLKPATTYVVNVWANGGPVAPPHSSISVTTKPKGSS